MKLGALHHVIHEKEADGRSALSFDDFLAVIERIALEDENSLEGFVTPPGQLMDATFRVRIG